MKIILLISLCYSVYANTEGKILGMYKFSFYADALGAPTEGKFLTDIVSSLVPSTHYKERSAHPWGMWIRPDSLKTVKLGLVTDDSYYKAFVLNRYRLWLKGKNKRPSDVLFATFLIEENELIKNKLYPYPVGDEEFEQSHAQHISDWLGMVSSALCAEGDEYCFAEQGQLPVLVPKNNFFQPDKAICFGLFGFLPLVSEFLDEDEVTVFKSFSSLTKLDRSHSSLITGISAVLLRASLLETQKEKSFLDWFRYKLREIINSLNDHGLISAKQTQQIKVVLNHSTLVASQLKNLDFESARKKFYEIRKDCLLGGVNGLKYDPLEHLFVIMSALTYGEGDIEKSLRLVINSGGDTDTIASYLALFAGAYYGESFELMGSELMSTQIDQVATLFTEQFDFDFKSFY